MIKDSLKSSFSPPFRAKPLFLEQLVHRRRDLAAMIKPAVTDDTFTIQNVDGGPTTNIVGLPDGAVPGILERGPGHLVLFRCGLRLFGIVVGMDAKQNEGLPLHLLDQPAEFARFMFDGTKGAPEQ